MNVLSVRNIGRVDGAFSTKFDFGSNKLLRF
jgi:hypothetical protein